MLKDPFSTDLARSIREEYPTAIAVPFADLESELCAVIPNASHIFRRMIDLFEISVTLAGLLCTSDVVRNGQPRTQAAERVLRELRENPRLSTGFWWELLREMLTLRLGAPDGGFSTELASTYFRGKGESSRTANLLDSIPGLRNRTKGHAWTLPDSRYSSLAEEHLPVLADMMAMLDLFRRWVLVETLALHPGGNLSSWDVSVHSGNYVRFRRGCIHTNPNLELHRLYLVRRSAISGSRDQDADPVPVHPLVVLAARTPDTPKETFLFQGAGKRVVSYLGTVSGERWEGSDSLEDLFAFFPFSAEAAISPFSAIAERLIAPLREAAKVGSAHFLNQVASEGVFNSQLYSERREAQFHAEAFQEGTTPAMLLLGASGSGKTCLVAALGSDWLSRPATDRAILLISAGSLPPSAKEFLAAIATALGLAGPLDQGVAEIERALNRGADRLRVLVVLDGVDRHSDPAAAMSGVDRVAHIFRGTRSFRLLVTITLTAIESLSRRGTPFDRNLFYQPDRGVGMTGSKVKSIPGYVLGPMNEDELALTYSRYRAQQGTAPTTLFEDLSDETKQALASPLFLRIAMEVFDGKPLPSRIFSVDMLKEYASKKIFSYPRRSDFVLALIDLMRQRRQRSISLYDLWDHQRMRSAALDDTAESPFVQLRDEQVLALRTSADPNGLPLPSGIAVELTFERVLEYLLLWRIAHSVADLKASIGPLLEEARAFLPLRGALVLLLFSCAQARSLALVTETLRFGEDEWTSDVLRDVFVDLFENDSSAGAVAAEIVTELSGFAPRATVLVVSKAVETLFLRGRWDVAYQGLKALAASSDLEPEALAQQENRLVLLCKNMDRWQEALEHSDRCCALLTHSASPDLIARAHVNRGSVLYDLGRRDDAAQAFRLASQSATHASLEAAASSNNLGIYHHYHDELDQAEGYLREARQWLDLPVASSYLATNLGLVLLTRSLVDPAALDEAEKILFDVVQNFRHVGHLQGISYAVSNHAICLLRRGRFEDARLGFEETIRLAIKIGEKWSAYGALANLAVLHLLQPQPDIERAWLLAQDAVNRARQNTDPKGIADALLIAGRAVLDMAHQQGPAAAPLVEASSIFEEAARTFAALGQRLGEGQAWLGLAERSRLGGLNEEALVFKERADRALRSTPFVNLPFQLQPLCWHMLLLMELF